MRRSWVLPLLLVSGFAGLSYELLWVRLLALGLGATTASFSIVLAVYFGGLALGSRWAGRRSVHAKRPLATYALLEAATGVIGLVLYPILARVGTAIAAIDPGPGAGGAFLRIAVSTIVLLPPTFLMGATLPFVSVGVIEKDEDAGPGTALIYGLNTLGGCLGAFFVTFFMLPNLGVFQSTLLTAGLNFLVAAVALVLSRRSGDGLAATTPPPADDPIPARVRYATFAAAGLGGLVATGVQVVWARLFAIVLRGTAYGVGSVLVAVLIGIALGSIIAAAVARRVKHTASAALLFQVFFLIGLLVFSASILPMSWFIGTLDGSGVSGLTKHLTELLVVLACLAVPTLAAGAVLPSLIAVMQSAAGNAGRTLARLYSTNTLGCIVGSLVTGFILLPQLGSTGTLYLMFLLLAVTVVLFAVATCAEHRQRLLASLAVVVIGAAVFPQADPRLLSAASNASDFFSYVRLRENTAKLVTTFYEGDVATVTVAETAGTKGLSLNGLGQGSRAALPPHIALESVLVATTPWLHTRTPQHALVVGLGGGGTADLLLKLGVEALEVAELEAGVIDAVESIWGDASPLKNPKVALIRNDARNHLLVSSRRAPRSFDLITSMPAHPWVASALFTREFFELARENLKPEGVFSTWFGPGDMPDTAIEGLFGAFTGAFPYTIIYWVPEAGAFYMVGSPSPLAFDVARAKQLVNHPATAGLGESSTEPLFMASRVTAVTTPQAPATARLVSTDDNGLIEFGVHRPRERGLLESLTYLPVRALPAAAITGTAAPEAFALEVFENTIGTRSGRLPLRNQEEKAMLRASSAIDPKATALKSYADFRLKLAQGKRAEAVALIPTITDDVMAERARVFAAFSAPTTERLAALKPFSARPDVRAFLQSLGDRDELPALAPPQPDDDPIGWLFVRPEELKGLAPEERIRITRALIQRIVEFESPANARQAEALFSAAGWDDARLWASTLVLDMSRATSNNLVRRALELGSRERYTEAVSLLLEAAAIAPLRAPQVRTLLQTALRVNDARAIAASKQMLLMRGQTPETVAALEESLREANRVEAAGKAPTTPAAP
ncbi:MAG: fused MFS/spermidine synthase [Myxococcaceae bacterium]|nr:fused MFS/spermidine synthase [Myxococcaceae bacterium]